MVRVAFPRLAILCSVLFLTFSTSTWAQDAPPPAQAATDPVTDVSTYDVQLRRFFSSGQAGLLSFAPEGLDLGFVSGGQMDFEIDPTESQTTSMYSGFFLAFTFEDWSIWFAIAEGIAQGTDTNVPPAGDSGQPQGDTTDTATSAAEEPTQSTQTAETGFAWMSGLMFQDMVFGRAALRSDPVIGSGRYFLIGTLVVDVPANDVPTSTDGTPTDTTSSNDTTVTSQTPSRTQTRSTPSP